mmetsp:Transcript_33249/g.73537  ORF Transcript_33249/g.73537 Transcript_33249/m.73537 type:complete len:240 (+) Transcript_33249:2232-2951(+)
MVHVGRLPAGWQVLVDGVQNLGNAGVCDGYSHQVAGCELNVLWVAQVNALGRILGEQFLVDLVILVLRRDQVNDLGQVTHVPLSGLNRSLGIIQVVILAKHPGHRGLEPAVTGVRGADGGPADCELHCVLESPGSWQVRGVIHTHAQGQQQQVLGRLDGVARWRSPLEVGPDQGECARGGCLVVISAHVGQLLHVESQHGDLVVAARGVGGQGQAHGGSVKVKDSPREEGVEVGQGCIV